MKKYFIYLAFAATGLLWSCSSDDDGLKTDVPPAEGEEVEEIIDVEFAQPVATVSYLDLTLEQIAAISGYNELGWKTFESLLNADPDMNHAISPVSINSALSLSASIEDDSNGRRQLLKCLGFEDADALDDFNQQLLSFLPSESNGVDLSLANSLWVSNIYTPAADLVKSVGERFGATVQSVDFNDPRTVSLINAWINDYTRGRIPSIVDHFASDPEFCIANALYLKGDWETSFDKKMTRAGLFYGTNGRSEVNYMEGKFDVKYCQSEAFKMVALPFKGEKVVMDLILPKNGENLAFEDYVSLCDNLSTTPDSVFIVMPKFEITPSYSDIADVLFKLGVPESEHYFSRLGFGENQERSINQIIHKMFVSVSETGAEAAAGTIELGYGSTDPGEPFTNLGLIYPFYFVIREVNHNIILAVGHIANL